MDSPQILIDTLVKHYKCLRQLYNVMNANIYIHMYTRIHNMYFVSYHIYIYTNRCTHTDRYININIYTGVVFKDKKEEKEK